MAHQYEKMTAYYNEHDKYAAQWLRNLIAAGLIAPGDVDERSIEDVRPVDLLGYTQCHFFAGIGVWSESLRRAGWPDDRPVWTGSCPCQPFSAAGKGGGTADERHLWPAWFHLVAHGKPHGVPVLGEQVASKPGLAWLDLVHADLEGQGYTVRSTDLCAAGVGAPHIRQRLYFVAESYDAERRADSAAGNQRNGQDAGRTQGASDAEGRSSACQLADRIGERHPMLQRQSSEGLAGGGDGQRSQSGSESGGCPSGQGGMGNAVDELRQRDAGAVSATQAGLDGARLAVDGSLSVGSEHAGSGLGVAQGDTHNARSQGRRVSGANSERLGESELSARTAGAVNGFWHDADWLPCIDGKARPVEPGTFPLAHGIAGRVGRLRAYGNAIVAPCAEAFIRAYMEEAVLSDLF